MKQNMLLLIGILFFLIPHAHVVNTLHNVEIALVTDTAHKQVSKTVFETQDIKYYLIEAPQQTCLVDSQGYLLCPISEWRMVTIDTVRMLVSTAWNLQMFQITEILMKGKTSQLPPQVASSRENGRIVSGEFPNFRIAFDYVTPFFKIEHGWVIRILEKETKISDSLYGAGLIIGGAIAMLCGFFIGYFFGTARLLFKKKLLFSKKEMMSQALFFACGLLLLGALFLLSSEAGTGVPAMEIYRWKFLAVMCGPFLLSLLITCVIRVWNFKPELSDN